MKKSLICTLLCVSLIGFAATSHAQVKLGTVDMNKIFTSYYKTKDAENRINDARNALKGELDERMDAYKKNVDVINKLNEDIRKPAISAETKESKTKERDDKIQETNTLQREISEFDKTRENQIKEQAVRMRNGIVDEITKLVLAKVKAENFDLVMDRSGLSVNGVPFLIFAKDGLDFSDEIIAQLNKNKPKDEASPSPAASPKPSTP
jgi:outer membrane protein